MFEKYAALFRLPEVKMILENDTVLIILFKKNHLSGEFL